MLIVSQKLLTFLGLILLGLILVSHSREKEPVVLSEDLTTLLANLRRHDAGLNLLTHSIHSADDFKEDDSDKE